jgi:hypothetical protein
LFKKWVWLKSYDIFLFFLQKIREHFFQKVLSIALIGKAKATNNKVSIRKIGSE